MCTSILGRDGRPIQLKWHSLRRYTGDAPIARANLEAGFEGDAVMEVDLRLTRDGHWVALHNDTLDEETSGTGGVAQQDRSDLQSLRMRTPSGRDTGEPLVFLEELVEAAHRWSLSRAELQLDMKVTAEELSDAVLDRFAREVGPLRASFSLSGTDPEALARLRSAVPGIPVTLSCSRQLGGARDQHQFEGRVAAALARLDSASMIWVNHRVLQAAYRTGFDLVGFTHQRGVRVDTGTIDVGAPGWLAGLLLAVQAGVDRITTNSPCDLQEQVTHALKLSRQRAPVG